MSSNNMTGFNNSTNNINQINQSNNSANNNNLNTINILPQRRIPVIGMNPIISNNSLPNRLLNNQINNINPRYNNSNNNLLLRYFNSNNSNINNNQEENNNDQNVDVSPMEVDNQVIYSQYEIEEEEMKEKIESLINLLNLQFIKQEFEIDFQLVYSKCYNICLHWKTNELFQEVEKLIKNVVLNILEKINKLNDEEPNYNFMNSFINHFQFFSKKISQTCDALSYMDQIYKKNLAATGGEDNTLCSEDSIIKFKSFKIYYENLIFNSSIKEKIIKVVTREFIN
jgi:hypothetical protein